MKIASAPSKDQSQNFFFEPFESSYCNNLPKRYKALKNFKIVFRRGILNTLDGVIAVVMQLHG